MGSPGRLDTILYCFLLFFTGDFESSISSCVLFSVF